jgi:imidazolonepropionase-like amidohydrolase
MEGKEAKEAIERGGRLGLKFLKQAMAEGYGPAEIYAACAITMDNIEKVVKLMEILGPEKFDELGEILMKHEAEKAIDEAEEALKDGE